MPKTSVDLAVEEAVARDPAIVNPTTVGPCPHCAGYSPKDVKKHRLIADDWQCNCDPPIATLKELGYESEQHIG